MSRGFLAALVLLAWGTNAHSEGELPLQRFEFQQIRMGVPWKVIFYAENAAVADDAQRQLFARVKQIDRALSDYDPDSELNQICENATAGVPIDLSEDLFHVLWSSGTYYKASRGSFDVTLGHVTDLWRRAYRKNQLPKDDDLNEALKLTGFNKLKLDCRAKTVTFAVSGMQLDLGGIAKGYAADEALKVLKKLGIDSALVDASGDIVVGNPPPGKSHWKIGIAPLENPNGQPVEFLWLKNASVATSGSANRYVEIEGIRYSHLVNPETGIGLTHSSSVTIVAPSGTAADALASAVSVMGPKSGLKILKASQAEGYVETKTDSGTEVQQSKGLTRYFEE